MRIKERNTKKIISCIPYILFLPIAFPLLAEGSIPRAVTHCAQYNPTQGHHTSLDNRYVSSGNPYVYDDWVCAPNSNTLCNGYYLEPEVPFPNQSKEFLE